MKICRFDANRVGVVKGDRVFDVTACLSHLPSHSYPLPKFDPLIEALPRLASMFEGAAQNAVGHALSDVKLLSPVANPGKVVAAPVNYQAHLEEAKADPNISFNSAILDIRQAGPFLKASSSVVGGGEGVEIRFPDRRNDHEIELVAVIGKQGDRIKAERALDHVAGYCIGLDMTVRGTEDRSLRKSVDTFSVVGPWMVTSDELRDPSDLGLCLHVNGVLRQSDRTKNLVLSLPELIVFASSFYTLHPGDLLFTGTPVGVGPVHAGDVITAEIEKIGRMDVAVKASASGDRGN